MELLDEIDYINQKISQIEEEALTLEKRLTSERALLPNENESLLDILED